MIISAEIIKKLEADGWRQSSQKGSHIQFRHPTKPGKTTVPHPKKHLSLATIKSIEKQSGLKLR